MFKATCVSWTKGLQVITEGPNKVLTFAGGPVVYECEWNQISRAKREQAYMYAIAGIIHGSSHLATLFLGESIAQAETRWRHGKHPRVSVFLDRHRYVIKDSWRLFLEFYFHFSEMQTARIITQQLVRVCRDGCQSWLVSRRTSHWRILIMLWMFVQHCEDNKASCFQRRFARKSTSHPWETAGARGLTCYENTQNSWNRGVVWRLHWIWLTLAWLLFYCKKCLMKIK